LRRRRVRSSIARTGMSRRPVVLQGDLVAAFSGSWPDAAIIESVEWFQMGIGVVFEYVTWVPRTALRALHEIVASRSPCAPQDKEDRGMVRGVPVVLEDDVDGEEAQETITFSLDGRAYEIDLSEADAVKLREVFAPWIASGRRAGTASSRNGSEPSSRRPRGPDTADIRRWAAENGMQVSSRGRIASEVRAKYEAAH
jgi:nucleoid-associated protein Lsr2